MLNISWDKYFMSMVYLVAMKSKDPNTKIGAVIVGKDHEIISCGFNGLPRGMKDDLDSYNSKPDKYFWYEHAERNAVYNAARNGIHTLGCTMYTQGVPCADCARGAIQAGIKEVVVHTDWNKLNNEKWVISSQYSQAMFSDCGVNLRYYKDTLIDHLVGLNNGTEFKLNT